MICINRLNDSYIDIRALQEALGLSRAGIIGLCKKGQLPNGFKVGRSRRWAVSEVNAWLRDKQKGATHE